MKCPHCKKEIEKMDSIQLFLFNCFYPLIVVGVILSMIDKYTKIPMSIEDGLKANYYLLPLVIISLFYTVYIPLYASNKVKGRLLFYTHWIDKKRN